MAQKSRPLRPPFVHHSIDIASRDSFGWGSVCALVLLSLRCAGDEMPTLAASSLKSTEQIVPQANEAPARRRVDDGLSYAAHCWAPGSAFSDPKCNCLGEDAHPKLGSRPTVKIVIGGWYVCCEVH
jgi:hypothetical protein